MIQWKWQAITLIFLIFDFDSRSISGPKMKFPCENSLANVKTSADNHRIYCLTHDWPNQAWNYSGFFSFGCKYIKAMPAGANKRKRKANAFISRYQSVFEKSYWSWIMNSVFFLSANYFLIMFYYITRKKTSIIIISGVNMNHY